MYDFSACNFISSFYYFLFTLLVCNLQAFLPQWFSARAKPCAHVKRQKRKMSIENDLSIRRAAEATLSHCLLVDDTNNAISMQKLHAYFRGVCEGGRC